MADKKHFIVIGGVEVNGWKNLPRFLRLAIKVQRIAKGHSGCRAVKIFRIGRIFHNVTVWDSPASMKGFARSGLHGDLMQDHRGILKSSFSHGFFAEVVPPRNEIVARWHEARDERL